MRRVHDASFDADAKVGVERGAGGARTIGGAGDRLLVADRLVGHTRRHRDAIHMYAGLEPLHDGPDGGELYRVRGPDGDLRDVGEGHGM